MNYRPYKTKKYNSSNNINNLQPVNINTNSYKGDEPKGKIIYEYDDYSVITYYEVHKFDNNTRSIFVKEQFINYYDVYSKFFIKDIYFENEQAIYIHDSNITRYSF